MSGAEPTSSITTQSSAVIFLVMRRMRMPLILLLIIFAVCVVGLSLIQGDSPEGPWRMSLFDAFYFMSYTATTIGFGEIPKAFNTAQRMWVTFSIYLSVVGWAYAFGALLTLVQQPSFKRAIAVQRFRRRVSRMSEPFWLLAGHGEAGQQVSQGLDALARRLVVIDKQQDRVDLLELGSYISDVPALSGDARDPDLLRLAGIENPSCGGVLALTDDDEANLAIVMVATVLRPELPVIARCASPAVERRMRVFGSPTIINPFDRFGDHFAVLLRAPSVERLRDWLSGAPGNRLPAAHEAIGTGRWVVCGDGRFSQEISRDLRADGIEVTLIESDEPGSEPTTIVGDGTDPEVLARAAVDRAAGFVAGTDNDILNVSMVTAARRVNPDLVVVARQNQPKNADLFEALKVDLLMIPSTVVAEDAIAQIGTPRLQTFLQLAARQDEQWAASLIDRIVATSGKGSPDMWVVHASEDRAPALCRVLARPDASVVVGDLLRDPLDRDTTLSALPLLLVRDDVPTLTPPDDFALRIGDVVLMAGGPSMESAMEPTLFVDTTATYVLTGTREPASWVWRELTKKS